MHYILPACTVISVSFCSFVAKVSEAQISLPDDIFVFEWTTHCSLCGEVSEIQRTSKLIFCWLEASITWPSPSRDYGMVGISSASEHVMRGFDCQHDLVILV